jgi:hypothetical protein
VFGTLITKSRWELSGRHGAGYVERSFDTWWTT